MQLYKWYGLLLWFIAVLPQKSYSQPENEFLTGQLKALKFSGPLVLKDPGNKLVSIAQGASCYNPDHHYLWLQNKLVLNLEGTGKLFEIKPKSNLTRLDSSCFEGYNFGSFNFVYNDTIFSLGGYGFWQFNGTLRYFDQKTNEWSVLPSNKSIPIKLRLCSNIYYDTEDKKIYLMYLIPKKIELDNEIDDRTVYLQCLDLVTKKWWKDARILNTEVIKDYDWLSLGYFHTKHGLILEWRNELFLLDFKNNDISNIEPKKNLSILNHLNISKKIILFSDAAHLNFYSIASGENNSVPFSRADIIKTGNPVYTIPVEKPLLMSIPSLWLMALMLIVSAGIIFTIIRVKKWKASKHQLAENPILDKSEEGVQEIIIHNKNSFKDNLTEIEKGLLEILVSNTLNNKMTTANQINQVLGVVKKPSKIQNNIRAANIQMINQKFMVYSGINDNLIIKERTEFDKRFFEFAIDNKYLVKVK